MAGIVHDVHVLAHPMSLDEFYATVEDVSVELVDGIPIVNPPPSYDHQVTLGALYRTLADAAPADFIAHLSPFDWVIASGDRPTVRQPDLMVLLRADTVGIGSQHNITSPPAIAVEILSPSSHERDLVTKRREYAAAGAEHYWIVDPHRREIVLLELRDGEYVEAHRMSGAALDVTEPFPARLDPDIIFRDVTPRGADVTATV